MSGLSAPAAAARAPFGGRGLALLVLAAAAVAGGIAAGPGLMRLALVSSGATIALTALLLSAARRVAAFRRRRIAGRVRAIVADDAASCFTTDTDGAVLYLNRAAEARFDRTAGTTLAATLGDIFADPAAVLYRLQNRAANHGAAREDVVTRRGHVRLSVHRLDDGCFLWRLEEMLDRAGPGAGRGAEAIGLPMLVASRTGTILFMNEALRRLVGGRPRTLDRIFTDTAFRPGETVLVAGATGPVRAMVAEVEGAGERREIYLLPALPVGPREVAVTEDDLPVALVRLGPGGAIRAANRRAREMLSLTPDTPATLPELIDGPGRPLALWLDDIGAGRLPPGPRSCACAGRPRTGSFRSSRGAHRTARCRRC
jgi:two-component system cell cycle sensor histidine kinase/response regulator CckA